jgi:hypothetical protein
LLGSESLELGLPDGVNVIAEDDQATTGRLRDQGIGVVKQLNQVIGVGQCLVANNNGSREANLGLGIIERAPDGVIALLGNVGDQVEQLFLGQESLTKLWGKAPTGPSGRPPIGGAEAHCGHRRSEQHQEPILQHRLSP